jgi:two-component system LytT family response regulator
MPISERRWGALVADDEPAARRGVRQLLQPFPEFAVVGECRDGAEVLASLAAVEPDVLFLDVQMPGLDGFEVITRRTPGRMPVVIFLTAHEQFAVDAFEAQALDYLVKPVSEARFAITMKRLTQHLRTATRLSEEDRIVAATSRGAAVLLVREIDWIEAWDNYARIWTGRQSYLLREPLRQLEERVRGHGFTRAHRCALVRLRAVRELQWTGDGELVAVLGSGVKIPVSRRRRAMFAKSLKTAKLLGP